MQYNTEKDIFELTLFAFMDDSSKCSLALFVGFSPIISGMLKSSI